MDFPKLPRRDLQALCKRNGVRANMTNAAMADALRALPKVDGIEEYVKQPVPLPEPEVKAVVAERKQGSPLPRGRRAVAPIEPEEDDAEENGKTKRQSSKDDAQAFVVGWRGAGRRARLSPAVAAPAAESAVAGAEEEQSEEVVEEDLKREESMDDAPALGVGRCGAKRRIQPASSIAALADMVIAEEEQRAPIPRGRRVKSKESSSELIRLDDRDDQEKEDAQILGVGRRGGASRRGQAPAVAVPEAKAEEEQRVPVPRGHRGKAKSTELIRLEDSKEYMKPEKERGDAPAIGVEQRGASKRAPSPIEAPATRRSTAASKTEAGNVSMEEVPIRATRQRKPTMKAVAAAAEKAPRRATRRGVAIQEEPQEAVGAPDVAVEVVPIRGTRQRKPTMKAAAAAAGAQEKAAPRATRRGAVMRTLSQQEVQEEPQEAVGDAEAVGAPVSCQRCDALEELEEASNNPQKEELNEDEDEDVVIIEDEKLMEETPAEEPSVTDHECMEKSEMQEPQVDDEKCHTPLATQEESPILGIVSMVTEQAFEDNESANFQDGGVSNSGLLAKDVCEETYHAGEEMELVPGVLALQAPLTANESDGNHESETGSVREVISEVDTKDDEVCKDKEHMDIAELQADIVDEAVFLDCLGNISQVAGEETNEEVNNEDGLSCQEEGDVVVDEVLHDSVDNTILLDCSSDISCIEVEKAGNITSKMPENQAALDEDGDKPNGAVIGDSISQATVTDEVVQEEKGVLITDELPQGTAGMHDMEDDQFETGFVQADKVVTAEQVTGCEITVEVNTSLIVDERQQSTVTMDEEVFEDHYEIDGVHSNEQIEVVTTDKVPELKLIEDVLVQADQVLAADNLPEQVTYCEITVEVNTSLIVDERQQSRATMDEDANEQMEVEVPELTETNVEVIEEKIPLGVEEKQNITVRMDTDVVDDHFKTDVVIADEMEVELTETDDEVVEEITPLVVDETQQSTVTNVGNNVDDHFKTHGARADEQKEVVATEVPEVTGTDGEIEEKTQLLVDEKKQSTNTVDKTFTAHADEQKEVIVTVTEVPDVVTGTDDEEKAVVITEEMPNQGTVPNIIHTLEEYLKENYFETDLGQGNEQKKAISADAEPEVLRAQDEGAWKENALLDDVTESVLEEKGVKAAIESEDLTKLSLGQLRAKLKEKLNAKKSKEAKKRVALARVDENVCRSHAKGPQQNLNLQQH